MEYAILTYVAADTDAYNKIPLRRRLTLVYVCVCVSIQKMPSLGVNFLTALSNKLQIGDIQSIILIIMDIYKKLKFELSYIQ